MKTIRQIPDSYDDPKPTGKEPIILDGVTGEIAEAEGRIVLFLHGSSGYDPSPADLRRLLAWLWDQPEARPCFPYPLHPDLPAESTPPKE